MHARKTGALIRAAAAAGAVMAGAGDAQLAAIERFASELGLAFQIVDDILDVEGASQELGKTAGKDAAAGKPTYPALYGLDASRRMAAECVERALRPLAERGAPAFPSAASCPRSRAGSRAAPISRIAVSSREERDSRLDTALVARGLAASRERARGLILAGQVRVNGEVVSKAGTPVGAGREPHPDRAGSSLRRPWRRQARARAGRLRRSTSAGRLALDVGASTGGFTDVLLRRGAPRVVALDVGHSQLDWKIRSDPRVVVLERINARTLTAGPAARRRARVRSW